MWKYITRTHSESNLSALPSKYIENPTSIISYLEDYSSLLMGLPASGPSPPAVCSSAKTEVRSCPSAQTLNRLPSSLRVRGKVLSVVQQALQEGMLLTSLPSSPPLSLAPSTSATGLVSFSPFYVRTCPRAFAPIAFLSLKLVACGYPAGPLPYLI